MTEARRAFELLKKDEEFLNSHQWHDILREELEAILKRIVVCEKQAHELKPEEREYVETVNRLYVKRVSDWNPVMAATGKVRPLIMRTKMMVAP